MSQRDLVLGNVRRALQEAREASHDADPDAVRVVDPAPEPAAAPPAARASADVVDRFAERVDDYRATVVRSSPDEVGAVIARALRDIGGDAVAVPAGLPDAWRPDGDLLDGSSCTLAELDAVDAVVTGCRVAIAETGTIVLDHGPDQGPRRLTLVPDRHVCVVRADQVLPDVDEAFAALRDATSPHRPPLTFVSGPSATSDIELERVEGVHGPRTLVVVLVADV